MNIVDVIRSETKGSRDKTAIVEGSRTVSYGQLFRTLEMAADELRAQGIHDGRRVAFLCPDSIDYVVVSLAILSLGAAIVPVAPLLGKEEMEAILEHIDVDAFLYDGAVARRENGVRVFSGGLCEREFLLLHREAKGIAPAREYRSLNPAFIRFSSGTTGASKGVLLSHESIMERTDAADRALRISPEDVIIWVLSMSFHFVVTILLFLRRAATIVLCCNFFPMSLLDGLKQQKGTFIYASPFHYQMMTSMAAFTPDLLRHVRLAISTAMTLPPEAARGFREKFHMELAEAYGIIEVGLPFVNYGLETGKRGSVGRILPDYRVRIANPDPNGVGAVHIKGQGLFDAYFSPWQTREQACPDGWFHTGDLGRLDDDGFLFILGREKNVINFTGMKIFPYEVEAILNRHPAIEESLVYGVEHPQYGQLPHAKVVVRKGVEFDEKDVLRFCYEHLAMYQVPKELIRVDGLARTSSGKIIRGA